MAALDPTNTDRMWVTYNDGQNDHQLMFRYDASATDEADVMDVVHDYLSAIEPALSVITIGVVEIAAEGSNVRNPITWTHDPSYGTGSMVAVNAPRYVEFTGRDNSGRRWHLTQFGVNITVPDTYEFNPGDLAAIDSARGALTAGFLAGTIESINKRKVVVNPSVAVGYNDHFLIRARG